MNSTVYSNVLPEDGGRIEVLVYGLVNSCYLCNDLCEIGVKTVLFQYLFY